MSKYNIPINKDQIDESNHFIKDTIFSFFKKSDIGSEDKIINLNSDDFLTYQLLSGKYNSKSSLDRCIVDYDKMKVIHAIHMYNYGCDYEQLLEIIKDNKYCYKFTEFVLKNKSFTKNNKIDQKNINKDTVTDKDSLLVYACRNNNTNNAIKLIDTLGIRCKPEQTDESGSTSLIHACGTSCRKTNLALKIIDTFGELCKPDHVNNYGSTALILACYSSNREAALKLIDTFGKKCKPEQVNSIGNTALIYACIFRLNDVVFKLIDKFGKLCKPDHVTTEGNTVLIFACYNNMNDIALKLINTFGKKCKPKQAAYYGKKAIDWAIENNMNDVVKKLKKL